MKVGNNDNARSSTALFLAMVAVLLTQQVREAGAVTCDPTSLRSCEGTILRDDQPLLPQCCFALEPQVPDCFCEYTKIGNPLYTPFVNSIRFALLAALCEVTLPTACP